MLLIDSILILCGGVAPVVLVTDIVLAQPAPIIDSSQLSPIVLNQLPLNYSDTPPWFIQPDTAAAQTNTQDVLEKQYSCV